MKYLEPKIELVMLDTKEIITVSPDKFEIETENEGNGKVIINALDIFF